jgi:hypoxanthine phosphoribosyltransferase
VGHDIRAMGWPDIEMVTTRLAATILNDGAPEVIVGIARGGLVPAVMLSHHLGVRDLRTVTFTHTKTDEVNATKTATPVVSHADSLGDLTGRDVLVVDDIAGTGDTLTGARTLLAERGAALIRTAVLRVNTANWQNHNQAPTFAGHTNQGWVVFPWEA